MSKRKNRKRYRSESRSGHDVKNGVSPAKIRPRSMSPELEEEAKAEAKKDRERMHKILPHLYIGSYSSSLDDDQLTKHKIRAIVRLAANLRKYSAKSDVVPKSEYVTIEVDDRASEDILKYVPKVNEFVHEKRMAKENVLIQCRLGRSRSVTLASIYMATVTKHSVIDCYATIKLIRSIARPNTGFRREMLSFQEDGRLEEERKKYEGKTLDRDHEFISNVLASSDRDL